MTIVLRIAILAAALLGYLLHSAMRPSRQLEVIGIWQVFTNFSVFSVWLALPYLLLITGIAFRARSAMVTVVIAIGTVVYIDYNEFLTSSMAAGWYIVLSPLFLLIPAAIGLGAAALANFASKQLLPDTGKKTPTSGEATDDPKDDV